MLLSEGCEVLGLRQDAGGLHLVVFDASEEPLISVVGNPAPRAIAEAVERAGGTCDVLATPAGRENVAAALPGWRAVDAVLHRLADDARLPEVPEGSVRLLLPEEIPQAIDDARGIADGLASELRAAASSGVPCAASFAGGQPVSFCYVAAETEGLWDVSIDTLEGQRRRGNAGRCAAYLIWHMRGRGKEPVWGAERTNAASLGLAASLGFVPVDRIVVFHPPGA